MKNSNQKDFDKLVELQKTLCGKKGCQWDRKQTIKSLKKDLMEEAREVALAIDKKDYENLKEELGDLLWDIIFMAQIAKSRKLFGIKDVMSDVGKKMVRRHPHVFGGKKAKTAAEARKIFNEVKKMEKTQRWLRQKRSTSVFSPEAQK